MLQRNITGYAAVQHNNEGVCFMLSFLIVLAFGASALLLVQRLDIECENPPKRRAREAPAKDHKLHPGRDTALTYSA